MNRFEFCSAPNDRQSFSQSAQFFTGVDGFAILLQRVHNQPEHTVPSGALRKNFYMATRSGFEQLTFTRVFTEQGTNQITSIELVAGWSPFHHAITP